MTERFLPYGDCNAVECGCEGLASWAVLALVAFVAFTVALRVFGVLVRDPLADFEVRRSMSS